MNALIRWLLLIGVVTGCAGPFEPGQLPTAAERCAFQNGSYRGGVCHNTAGQ
jgi:hypothetical protein